MEMSDKLTRAIDAWRHAIRTGTVASKSGVAVVGEAAGDGSRGVHSAASGFVRFGGQVTGHRHWNAHAGLAGSRAESVRFWYAAAVSGVSAPSRLGVELGAGRRFGRGG